MMKECMTFKVFSLLLSYPEEEIQKAGQEFKGALKDEGLLSKKFHNEVIEFIEWMEKTDLLDLQENYVNLFDRKKSLSLYFFEHIHGDSKDRGPAMVDLSNLYKNQGMEISSSELPDFLPAFLEYLSTLSRKEAKNLLKELIDILTLLEARLKKNQSPYASLFGALQNLTTLKPNLALFKDILSQDLKEPLIGDELDKEWEEAPVTFGKESLNCSSCPTQNCHPHTKNNT